jgi:hypothetical protein
MIPITISRRGVLLVRKRTTQKVTMSTIRRNSPKLSTHCMACRYSITKINITQTDTGRTFTLLREKTEEYN